jgi:hypothetical protein
MSIQFWQTPMGKRFYEYTLPELVREVARLNGNIEKLVCTLWEGRIEQAARKERG